MTTNLQDIDTMFQVNLEYSSKISRNQTRIECNSRIGLDIYVIAPVLYELTQDVLLSCCTYTHA